MKCNTRSNICDIPASALCGNCPFHLLKLPPENAASFCSASSGRNLPGVSQPATREQARQSRARSQAKRFGCSVFIAPAICWRRSPRVRVQPNSTVQINSSLCGRSCTVVSTLTRFVTASPSKDFLHCFQTVQE